MADVISVIGLAIVSTFATIVLSGALSGLITLGLIDQFLRGMLQRSIMSTLVDRKIKGAESSVLSNFLRQQYIEIQQVPNDENSKRVEAYTKRLAHICQTDDLIPQILGIPVRSSGCTSMCSQKVRPRSLCCDVFGIGYETNPSFYQHTRPGKTKSWPSA